MPKQSILKFIIIFLLATKYISILANNNNPNNATNQRIYIAFLWHMHQPIYWPYETIVQTQLNNRYPYSVFDIHNQRVGPYTSWPRMAVQRGINAGFQHFGAQVSISGSLIENLNNLEAYGNHNFQNWKLNWNIIKNQTTVLGNPRMDLVAFGYHHPLMALIEDDDIRRQIQEHKRIFSANFPGNYSKGIFPPENAFTPRMIPSLRAEGIDWVLVDNIHFERACIGYPYSPAGNLYEPNKADLQNPNPNDWRQLTGLWAPTSISARWAHQPHYVEYVDPNTGIKSKIIAVPASRYLGNEDGRGGFGALNYELVLSQLESFNTDPNHPILVVLAHDGDNYGGGSESYYNSNFQNFVNWLQVNSHRFVCTTIQDYLQMFPPNPNDIIHVEDGSWSGADNGDPEFKKWLGVPDNTGYSPDRNSWAVITATKNFVSTAQQIAPNNPNTQNALKFFLNAQASDYWYWDYAQGGIWDSHPTRACNQAIQLARLVTGSDNIGPTIFIPQREPYNPGETEWGIVQPSNLKIWSYVYDISGLKSVKLKYRTDNDGINSRENTDNETYIGGSDVSIWVERDMTSTFIPSRTNPLPIVKALEFSAEITGLTNKLVDYYIEAVDSFNNISRSPIRHVWIGNSSGSGGSPSISWLPTAVTINDTITIKVRGVNKPGRLHWGVNGSGNSWQTPNNVYWPAGTVLFNGVGPAVESPMAGPDSNGDLTIKIGPFNNPVQSISRIAFVIHFNDGTWNNNNGRDYHIILGGASGGPNFVMDGQVDSSARKVATNAGRDLFLGWNGTELYVATQSAQSQNGDVFVFISDSLRNLVSAPWAKSGQVTSWSIFLGNESTNNWSGWFDNTAQGINSAGAFLEGAFNVATEFYRIPNRLYIAVGLYQTQNNGTLISQIPAGNGNGNIEQNEFYLFDFNLTSLQAEEDIKLKDFKLFQNYPNPFNEKTIISWQSPVNAHTTLKVYDLLGNEVDVLVDEFKFAGNYEMFFDASKLASGMYFYTLKVGNISNTKKMILLK